MLWLILCSTHLPNILVLTMLTYVCNYGNAEKLIGHASYEVLVQLN